MAYTDYLKNLSTSQIILLGISFVVSFIVLQAVIKAAVSPLRHVPGPFWARFSRLWYWQAVWRGDFEKTNIELHKKYGPIVRIGPNDYSIDDPKAIKTIYGHGTEFTKGPWYIASGGVDPHITNLFVERDPHRHASDRRKVASLYSTTHLMSMEEPVVQCIENLEAALDRFATSGVSFNMQHWLQRFAFDCISIITLAKSFGFLTGENDPTNVFHALHTYLVYCTHVGIFNEFHQIAYRLLGLLSAKSGLGWISSFTIKQVEQRMREDEEKGGNETNDDFLAKALRLHKANPDKVTFGDVLCVCITNIGAGSDTTSVSLSGIMYGLIKNPEAMKKLRAEIDEKAAAGELSHPIRFQESQKMPYLQACIKEGLRLHPATGLPMGRVVPKGGATISDVFFPENTIVGMNSWVAHYNKSVFGEDADVFRPERWLEDQDRAARMERYWIPFGHGSRTCIGKNISLMEISKIVPELVQKFDFALTKPLEELKCENNWFVQQKNFNCTVTRRKPAKA
ncbi:cytochrome P450 [Xylogone sp. PMI_703]|nr:cytochrome P450 [Xylogone sp. PMI_703]